MGSGVGVGVLVAAVAGSVSAGAKRGPNTSTTTSTTASSSGATLGNGVIFGGGSFGLSSSRRIGVRQTSTGVTLRAYSSSLPSPMGARGPFGTIPATCFPDRQVLVEYSTPDIAGIASFESRHDQPATPQGQLVGVVENRPTAVMAALVPANSQRVVMQFTGGHTDSAAPLPGGLVVLASPVKSTPASRHPVPLLTDRPAPLGNLSVVDHRGHRHSLGAVPGTGGFATPQACFGPAPGSTTPVTAPPLALPQPTGPPPADQAGARQAIEAAYHRLFEAKAGGDPQPDIEGGPPLSDAERKHLQQAYGDILGKLTVRVNDFRFLSPTEAALSFDLLLNGQPVTAATVGRAVLVSGQWKVTKATFCEVVGRGGVQCKP